MPAIINVMGKNILGIKRKYANFYIVSYTLQLA